VLTEGVEAGVALEPELVEEEELVLDELALPVALALELELAVLLIGVFTADLELGLAPHAARRARANATNETYNALINKPVIS
jgi:hypothetical protein